MRKKKKMEKKGRMKTEKIKDYRVNYIYYIGETSMSSCLFMSVQSISKNGCSISSLYEGWSNHLFSGMSVYPGYTGTLVILASTRHAAKCAKIR